MAAIAILLVAQSDAFAQSRLEAGTKAEAVAGSEAMLERNYALADSLFGAAEGWNGAAAGQISLNRGMALAGEGNTDGALKAFQRAAAQSEAPGIKADAWNNVGNLLLGSEDVEGAIEAYKTSLRLDPRDAETRYNLNLAMAMRQQQEEQQQQQQENGDEENGENEEDSEQQENQDNGSQENQDGEGEDQENPDEGEQDQEGEEGQDNPKEDEQPGEEEQNPENKEGEDSSKDPQEGDESSPSGSGEKSEEEPQEGKIQAADAERILDMLERNEAALRAKLQAQENAKRNKGKKTKIEKDW